MKTIEKKLLILLILLISVTTSFGQSKANGLQDLVGAKGSSAENELENRGYYHIKTDKTVGNNIYSYWWNSRQQKCILYNLNGGKIYSILNTLPSDCNKSTNTNTSGRYGKYNNSYAHQAHHHDNNSHYSNQSHDDAYERGFNDGLHNKSYHNIYNDSNEKNAYSKGYGSGVGQRNRNTSYHSGYGGYKAHVQVNDLNDWLAESAYDVLGKRGFIQNKRTNKNGKVYTLWYNRSTDQCIRTIETNRNISTIESSTYCDK
ncbi:MAG: hypothetical protein J7K34_07585 [Flavobacteriaceae bacterium]|nr:hypothetical protein [Flavobacteriaceae bacterium]